MVTLEIWFDLNPGRSLGFAFHDCSRTHSPLFNRADAFALGAQIIGIFTGASAVPTATVLAARSL